MTDEAFVTRGRGLQPVGEMPAITGPGRRLSRAVDEGELADRLIGRRIEVVSRSAQRVAEDVACEPLAVTRGADVIRQQHDVTGLREQMVVPSACDRIPPHVGVPAVDEHQERILFRFLKRRRQREKAVNLSSEFIGEPEFAQRLPVDGCRLLSVEGGQTGPLPRGKLDAVALGGTVRRFPIGEKDRRRGLGRNVDVQPDPLRSIDRDPGLTAAGRDRPDTNTPRILGGAVNRLAVRRKSEVRDGSIKGRRDRTHASVPGPGRGSEAAQRIVVSCGRGETNPFSIRTEHRLLVADFTSRQRTRFSAGEVDLVKMVEDFGVGGTIHVRGGGENNRLRVRRPRRLQVVA